MSKYTTSPGNEADVTRVEVVASNSMTPTVVTRDGIWMVKGSNPTAQGIGTNPTVSTENTIRAGNGATPTAGTSATPVVSAVDTIRASNSATPTVIEDAGVVGPAAQGIGNNPTVSTANTIFATCGTSPTAEGVTGQPTVRGDDRIRMVNGMTPTVSTVETIRATNGATPTAVNGATPTVFTEDNIRAGAGATPTVSIENTIFATSGTAPTAGNSLTPTVSTVDTIRANDSATPFAGTSATPTVSTVETIRAGNGLTPTVIENIDVVGPKAQAVGGTPVVIAPDSDVGGTPTAQAVGNSPTAQGNNGNPTVRGDDRIRLINGATPTAHLLRVIVATQGTTNVAQYRSPATTAQERLAA